MAISRRFAAENLADGDLRIDIDMAADMGCAHLQSLSNLSPGLPVGIDSHFTPNATLIFDPVGQARPGRQPWSAPASFLGM
jgi:hypothetical protein